MFVSTDSLGNCSPVGKLSSLKTGHRRLLAIVSAAVLASLTVGVFYQLQDYGPESAIRRFNELSINDNDEGLKTVIADNAQLHSIFFLKQKLKEWYQDGATMQLAQMERSENEVRAAVLFTIPAEPDYPLGTQWAMIWVVVRRGKSWLVDVNKTATILGDQLPRLRGAQGF